MFKPRGIVAKLGRGSVCVVGGGRGGGSPSLRPGIVEMFQRLSPSVRQVCEITSVFLKFV